MLKQENLVETLISTSLVPGPYRANKYMSKKKPYRVTPKITFLFSKMHWLNFIHDCKTVARCSLELF